jgi:hypothetical protein
MYHLNHSLSLNKGSDLPPYDELVSSFPINKVSEPSQYNSYCRLFAIVKAFDLQWCQWMQLATYQQSQQCTMIWLIDDIRCNQSSDYGFWPIRTEVRYWLTIFEWTKFILSSDNQLKSMELSLISLKFHKAFNK